MSNPTDGAALPYYVAGPMRTLTLATLSLLLCAPLFAQGIDAVPQRADVVELAPATLDELARTAVAAPYARHDERPRPHRAAKRAASDAIVADFVTAAAATATPPPAVTRGFRASFDPLPLATTGYAPADASGAVGPHHVVGAFNTSLTVHDRDGNQLSLVTMNQFWHDPAVPDTPVYDPRVMYDAANDRWALAMLTDTDGRLGVLLLAFSATPDPTGAWRRFRAAASSDPNASLDYTRMAMTADQIVVTATQYTSSLPAARIYVMPKSIAFSDAASLTVTRTLVGGVFELTPVSSSDTAVRLLVQDDTVISQYTWEATQFNLVASYQPPASFQTGGGECDQLGTSMLIECGDSSLHYAFIRAGVLWIVHSANDGVHGFIVIWKITGQTAKGFVIRNAGGDYGYPSLAVNRFGAALVGYSSFSASMYASAGYRYIDPSGNVSDPGVVKGGEDWYTFERWGDYSTTVVDPADDSSFWTLQSYTTPAFHGNHTTWGTWWSYVRLAPPRIRVAKH